MRILKFKSQLTIAAFFAAVNHLNGPLTKQNFERFPFNQNSGNFGCYIKWNGPFQFGLTGTFGTSFEGGPL